MRISILPLLFVALGAAAPETISRNVDLGKQFTIKPGQQVVVRGEKFSITFKSVSDDSRCPTGVQCVWAGNAAVQIEVSKKKPPMTATLNTTSEPKEITYKGFKIRLEALSPYPKANQPIDPKRYEATLMVIRAD